MAGVRVRFLGSGDAFFAGGRHQAGYLLDADGESILLDCGSATLASIKRRGIPAGSIGAICLSHLHGDHFAGIPFLFLEYIFAEARTRPLTVAGPPGTETRVAALFGAMYPELASRPLPFPLHFVELLPDRPAEIGSARIEPFRVPHQEKEISLALGVRLNGRQVLYSGDTGWTEDLVARAQGTDLFICECSFFETRMPSHLDYPRIAENASRFGTNRLVLTHLGSEVLARAREVELETASDGLILGI